MDASGTLLSEQRYLSFGEVRADVGTAITQTDFGYTGQRNLGGMGLMDYNARFYSPTLGRFIQPDTIVPNYAYPQTYNRYTYSYNNPIMYTDDGGNCPKPSKEAFAKSSGEGIICFAAFIPTEFSKVKEDIKFTGDNRSFSSNSESSRGWVWIDAGTGKNLDSEIQETCMVGEDECHGPRDVQDDNNTLFENWLIIEEEDGNITVDFGIICDSHGGYNLICALTFNGTLTFTPNEAGSFDVEVDVNDFPNYESYYWEDETEVHNLFQIQNFSQEELNSGVVHPGNAVYGSINSTNYSFPPLPPRVQINNFWDNLRELIKSIDW